MNPATARSLIGHLNPVVSDSMLALLYAAAAFQAPPHGAPLSSVTRAATPVMAGYEGFWEKPEFQQKQDMAARKAGRKVTARSTVMPSVSGKVTPARQFEQTFAPLFVPSREAKRRPDLEKMNDVTRARAFENSFAQYYVPSREAQRRPDLKQMKK